MSPSRLLAAVAWHCAACCHLHTRNKSNNKIIMARGDGVVFIIGHCLPASARTLLNCTPAPGSRLFFGSGRACRASERSGVSATRKVTLIYGYATSRILQSASSLKPNDLTAYPIYVYLRISGCCRRRRAEIGYGKARALFSNKVHLWVYYKQCGFIRAHVKCAN